MAYATSGFIAIILADYIRRLGYPAKAHYAPYYDVVLPPIILSAGLGERAGSATRCSIRSWGLVSKGQW